MLGAGPVALREGIVSDEELFLCRLGGVGSHMNSCGARTGLVRRDSARGPFFHSVLSPAHSQVPAVPWFFAMFISVGH